MRPVYSQLFVWMFLLAATAPSVRGDTKYVFTDLSLPGQYHSAKAWAINNLGQVVGVSYPEGVARAFLYSGGVMQDLLPSWGISQGINDVGEVVGIQLSPAVQGFLYSDGRVFSLGYNYEPTDINESGIIVGSDGQLTRHAFVYEDGKIRDLGVLAEGGSSFGRSINNGGTIVGEAAVRSGNYWVNHAFVYESGSMRDLGALSPAGRSGAFAINDAGIITGYSGTASGATHAFIYAEGQMRDLGALAGSNSYGYDINNLGVVVGGYGTSVERAFIFDGTEMVDLNSLVDMPSGWTLARATGVNDCGQIVGFGSRSDYAYSFAFLLTPVPEPGTTALMAIGVLAMSCRSRRHFRKR